MTVLKHRMNKQVSFPSYNCDNMWSMPRFWAQKLAERKVSLKWSFFFFFFSTYFPPVYFESLLNQCTSFGIHSNLQQRITVQLWLATISSSCWTCALLVPCFVSKVRHWKFPRLSFPLQSLSTATHLLSQTSFINFPTSFGLLSPFTLFFADFLNFECKGTKAEHHIQTAYTSWTNVV